MDRRTKRQKLEAMAKQTASPQEAAIAKKKLEELGPDKPVFTPRFSSSIYSTSGNLDFNDESVLFQWSIGTEIFRSYKGKHYRAVIDTRYPEGIRWEEVGINSGTPSYTFTASYTTFKK